MASHAFAPWDETSMLVCAVPREQGPPWVPVAYLALNPPLLPPPPQASSLVSAIAEPLVTIDVGRMMRQLADPVKLRDVDGSRGQLSLWLLPNDDLSLMWRHTSSGPRSRAGAEPALEEDVDDSREGGLFANVTETACHLSFWEEIAHFPAGAHLTSDEPRACVLVGEWRGGSVRKGADTASDQECVQLRN